MVRVTFNDEVECHQYDTNNTAGPATDVVPETDLINRRPEHVDPTILDVGPSRLKYDPKFLMSLRNSPLAQSCPDLEIVNGKAKVLFRKELLKPLQSSNKQTGKQKSVFMEPPFGGNKNRRSFPTKLTPWNDEDSRTGQIHLIDYAPIQPMRNKPFFAQGNRFTAENPVESRDPTAIDEQQNVEPEWYRVGATSRNDFIELHGFAGDDEQNATDEKEANKKVSFGSNDGNYGASFPHSSPPAKSTPAKGASVDANNDSQQKNGFAFGRSNHWPNFSDNHKGAVDPLHEFLKQVKPNPNIQYGEKPMHHVKDIEAREIDHFRFRQMIAQLPQQNLIFGGNPCFNFLRNNPIFNPFQPQDPIPNASQILAEIEKLLLKTTNPIFKRPEVRKLVRNVVESVIPPHDILSLLRNPMTEPHSRETINAVIHLIKDASNNAAVALRGSPPQISQAQLKAHTEAIMQNAIIKKRIETLSSELIKLSTKQSPFRQVVGNTTSDERGFLNQRNAWQQPKTGVSSPKNGQRVARVEGQLNEAGNLPVNNQLNRWFSPTLLNKAAAGQVPSLNPLSGVLRLEEIERPVKTKLSEGEEN